MITWNIWKEESGKSKYIKVGGGGSFLRTQHQYDLIYVQPLIVLTLFRLELGLLSTTSSSDTIFLLLWGSLVKRGSQQRVFSLNRPIGRFSLASTMSVECIKKNPHTVQFFLFYFCLPVSLPPAPPLPQKNCLTQNTRKKTEKYDLF